MSIIVRPTKPIGGGGGTSWISGADLYANELNADIDTLYADYNGNITNANIAALAAIEGSKFASAPNGIPAGKYNALSVKGADVDNATLGTGKLKITIQEIAWSQNVGSFGSNVSAKVDRKTTAGNYEATVRVVSSTGAGVYNLVSLTVVPTTAIVAANSDLVGLYISDFAFAGGVASGKAVFVSISKT